MDTSAFQSPYVHKIEDTDHPYTSATIFKPASNCCGLVSAAGVTQQNTNIQIDFEFL